MNGQQFIRRVRRYARKMNVACRVENRGKGSHSRLYLGDGFTTVKHGEIKPALLSAMLKQLGIDKEGF